MFKQLENGHIEVAQDGCFFVVDLGNLLNNELYTKLNNFTGIVDVPGYGEIACLKLHGDGFFAESHEFGIFLDTGIISIVPVEIGTKLGLDAISKPDIKVKINLKAGVILKSNDIIVEVGDLVFNSISDDEYHSYEDKDEDEDEF